MTEGSVFQSQGRDTNSLDKPKIVWRNPAQLQLVKAENGWVVHYNNLCWVAGDTNKLVALVQVLADEFEEKDVQI